MQTVVSALSLNGVVYAMDSEADWAFAANNLAKRSILLPSPTQKGMPTNCVEWKFVEKTDTCDTIINQYKSIKLTEDKFLELNPALEDDCEKLKPLYYVCVQTGAAPTAAATGKSTATAAAAAAKTTAKAVTTSTTKPAAAADDEVEERHADNPPAVKLTTKNPTAPKKLEAEEEDQYLITGAGDTTLKPRFCAPRRNIVNLQAELPDTFNLLVLALDKMMKTPDSDAFSYFQVSGIHGAPYWDWAESTEKSKMPPVTMEKTITVMGPDGQGGEKKTTIANPFYSYVFKGKEGTVFSRSKAFSGLKATARRPAISGSSDSIDEAADNAMQSGYLTRRKQTYNTLTSVTSFNYFSNSLEKLHNDVHMQVGGNGIMGLISFAAFDPIFWLHHNNIDRMLAIWQAANPGRYLTPDTATPSFQRTVEDGDKDDLNTPLYPWKHPNGKFWTSADVKDVQDIWSSGYGYPEVPCYHQGDTNTLDDFATEAINKLYSDVNAPKIKGRSAVQAVAAGQNVTEWDINIIVDQAELPGTFSIYVFLGNPPADPKNWDLSSQKVSTMTLLGTPGVAKMSKLEGMTIPLGPLLAKKGVKGTDKEIQDYLAKYLVWTCLSLNDEGTTQPHDVKTMKSLKVAVTSRSVVMPTDMKAKPIIGKATIQTAATKDKAKSGGASTLSELTHTKLKSGAEAHLRIGILPDIQNTTVTGGKI
ncbi:hypothetical protein TWF481_006444 [Arthrobotrys musiformis]|uniref:tyrosinase n=1 Tax=Arthrobotrys musiformis TaxID=47236 RepID=A0AAV9WGP2_9PEZI